MRQYVRLYVQGTTITSIYTQDTEINFNPIVSEENSVVNLIIDHNKSTHVGAPVLHEWLQLDGEGNVSIKIDSPEYLIGSNLQYI